VSIVLSSFFNILTKIILDILTHVIGKQYFLFLLILLFLLIVFYNLFGLIPYSFAVTSYFSVTFFFSFIFFFSLFFIGILLHGVLVLNLFIPPGTPFLILPLLFVIEIISYFARVFSLAIRLFANITAGHILLYIFSWFVSLLFDLFLISFIGFFVISILWILETFISVLQAYVFVVLLTLYLNEILFLEH
jgi:F-type H+-transporting ATPase subunit a